MANPRDILTDTGFFCLFTLLHFLGRHIPWLCLHDHSDERADMWEENQTNKSKRSFPDKVGNREHHVCQAPGLSCFGQKKTTSEGTE